MVRQTTVKTALFAPLANTHSPRDNTFIAHLSPVPITPNSLLRRLAHDHRGRPDIVPHRPTDLPELAAADRGVALSLESVLSDNTKRTYDTQWRIFDGWCVEVGLQ